MGIVTDYDGTMYAIIVDGVNQALPEHLRPKEWTDLPEVVAALEADAYQRGMEAERDRVTGHLAVTGALLKLQPGFDQAGTALIESAIGITNGIHRRPE